MTISVWIALLISFAAGGIIGLIAGTAISDSWWRKHVAKYSHLIPPANSQNDITKGKSVNK